MDADDVSHPERLARQAERLATRPVAFSLRLRGEGLFPRAALAGAGFLRYVDWLNRLHCA